MQIRNCKSEDHQKILSVLSDWWGGRNMTLPRLFFDHFQNTSYIVEENGGIIGFLIGFLSQSQENEAYIHFVGVHPDYRKQGLAKGLYDLFFEETSKQGVNTVRCITSIVNKKSIAFHTRIGFDIESGDKEMDGISVHSNHGGEGKDRVLFVKKIDR